MNRIRLDRTGRIAATFTLASMVATAAATGIASADNSISECVTENTDVSNIVCHEVRKMKGTPSNGQVSMAWQLVPGDLTSLKGGLWMTRTPIEGQQTGPQTYYPDSNSYTLCAEGNDFTGCYKNYSGRSGSIVLDFPVSMAGYQYMLHASEELYNDDGDIGASDLYDNTEQTIVWVNKAFQYKANGRTVVKRKCPANLASKCKPAVIVQLNDDPGTGVPVSPVN